MRWDTDTTRHVTTRDAPICATTEDDPPKTDKPTHCTPRAPSRGLCSLPLRRPHRGPNRHTGEQTLSCKRKRCLETPAFTAKSRYCRRRGRSPTTYAPYQSRQHRSPATCPSGQQRLAASHNFTRLTQGQDLRHPLIVEQVPTVIPGRNFTYHKGRTGRHLHPRNSSQATTKHHYSDSI